MPIKRRSFRSSSNYIRESSDYESKGNGSTIRINWKELERHISILARNCHKNIDNIKDSLKISFDYLTTKSAILYDQEDYSILTDMIATHFKDIKNLESGTIGAHCYGCISQKGSSFNSLCTPICSNSIRDNDNIGKCENTVIRTIKKNGDYKFKVISLGEDEEGRSHAWVHIDDIEKESEFNGFTTKEKKQLKNMGVTHITLIGYRRRNSDYIYITDMFPLENCKTRSSKKVYSPLHYSGTIQKSNVTISIIILVIIIVILAIIGIKRRR